MSLSLKKGQKLSLQKDNPSLSKIRLGLGWDTQQFSNDAQFDLDVTAVLLNGEGKCENENIVFYNKLKSNCESVIHTGDNRTGEGDGDDESIKLDLNKIPDNIKKIVFIVTIDEATSRNQNFGQVENAFVRIVDEVTESNLQSQNPNSDENFGEIARFDLSEDFSVETAVVFCELYKNPSNEWAFNAIGNGDSKVLLDYFNMYGIATA